MRLPLLPRELHLSDRPSSTAQLTTLGRALELSRPQTERIVDDPFAPAFLSAASTAALHALRAGSPGLHAAERSPFGSLSTFALCRHRFMDEHMIASLTAGAQQVLMLGAGYDSRAYRFADELAGCEVFEVDLAPISRRKADIVDSRPELFARGSVQRIEIDFRVDSLTEHLVDAGFDTGAPTYVVWEGVTPYLSSDAVSATLETIATVCGSGSRLALDLWRGPGQPRGVTDHAKRVAVRAFTLIGEPVQFGVPPERADALLGAHGLTVIDLVQSEELADRYSTDGRPCERALYVVAAVL